MALLEIEKDLHSNDFDKPFRKLKTALVSERLVTLKMS
jgi:hypothetical protein